MMSEDSNYKLYNQSLENAYNVLLNQKRSFHSSAVADSVANESEHEASEFSEEESEINEAMIQDDEYEGMFADVEDEDYSKFKKSLLRDHSEDLEWLDDEEATDYTDDSIRSFVRDKNDPDYPYVNILNGDRVQKQRNWVRWVILGIIGLTITWFLSYGEVLNRASPDLSKRVNHLQMQLNRLINEADVQRTELKSNIDSNINLIIQQFEKRIKRVLPKDINKLESDIAGLETQIKQISQQVFVENITHWQHDLLYRLNEKLPEKIPIIMENNTNMLIIPELHEYLSALIIQVVKQSVSSLPQFNYNMNDYIKEVLNDNFQFIEKRDFLEKLEDSLSSAKDEIWEELEFRLSKLSENSESVPCQPPNLNLVPQQFSSLLLKKLVHKIYNSNKHQWESDLNIATLSQGTYLLNHLCSKTHHGPVEPVDLLHDCNGCTSTYWHCQSQECSWAIRLAEPMYLIKLGYMHGRFSHNLNIMSAAPKTINVYAKFYEKINDPTFHIPRWKKASKFLLLGSWDYDIFDNAIRQDFELPLWFIEGKYLVRAIAFEVILNHGNEHYTSLKKFFVNAVTIQDLKLMDKFPQDWRTKVPNYSIMENDQERIRASRKAKLHAKENVPSFGEDEIVT